MKYSKPITIFLVDDDPLFLKVLETQFKEQTEFEIKSFSTGDECLSNLWQNPRLIFLDYHLSDDKEAANNGLRVLDSIKAKNPLIEVVMLSSQSELEVAVNCMKHQALDYIIKSEGAFIRAKKTIGDLFYRNRLEKELSFYKTTSIIVLSLIGLSILSIFLLAVFFPRLMSGSL
ncbi:MAG: response regulator [bacterium]|nr:response regulator [bacterium]